MKLVAFLVVAALVIAALAAVAGPNLKEAHACSLVAVWDADDVVPGMSVVAIGVFRDVEERRATFVVEDGIKGVSSGDELAVDNRHPGLGADCSTYHEDASGNRFRDGERVLLLLERQVDGLWRPGLHGTGAYPVPVDDFAPLIQGWITERPPLSLDEVRRRVRDAEQVPGEEFAAREKALGCQPMRTFDPEAIEAYAGLATAVAIVEVAPGEYPQEDGKEEGRQATVREVLRGELAAEDITLNGAWISDYHTGDCTAAVETGTVLRPGATYLVFLTPDEFGIAQYRSVAWNQSAVEINERYVVGAYDLTLGSIREAAGQVPAPEPEETEVPAAESGGATPEPSDPGPIGEVPQDEESDDGPSGAGQVVMLVAQLAITAGLALALVVGYRAIRRSRAG